MKDIIETFKRELSTAMASMPNTNESFMAEQDIMIAFLDAMRVQMDEAQERLLAHAAKITAIYGGLDDVEFVKKS